MSYRPAKKPRKTLTAKQEGFARDFVILKNQTEAAIRNYNTKSRAIACVIGNENLKKPNIVAMIKDLKDKFVEDSYTMYEKQKELAEKTRNEELKNKIYNKILDRAGFTPTQHVEKKQITAKYVFKR